MGFQREPDSFRPFFWARVSGVEMEKKIIQTVFLAGIFLLVSGVSEAQGDDRKVMAKRLFEAGINFFDQENYESAAEAFREAYRTRPSWKILYNIGQSEAAEGRYGLAMEAFQQYLVDGKDEIPSERREYVLKEIKNLRELVGQVVIKAPAGSVVYIDKVFRGKLSGNKPILVVGGKTHELIVLKDEKEILRRHFSVWGGKSIRIKAGEPVEESAEPEQEESPERVWTWVAYGIGGAATLGAIITGSIALSKRAMITPDCNDNVCPDRLKDDADTVDALAVTTDVFISFAVVGAAAGTVLYFFEPEWFGEVSITPSAGSEHIGLAVGGRF